MPDGPDDADPDLQNLAGRATGTQDLTGSAPAVATMRNYQIDSRPSSALAEPALLKRLVLALSAPLNLNFAGTRALGFDGLWRHVPASVWASCPSETNHGGEAASRLFKLAPSGADSA